MDKIWDRIRYVSVALFASAIVIFAAQNGEPFRDSVTVSFLIWEFQASIALLILVSFLGGLFIGMWAIVMRQAWKGRARKKKEKAEARAEAEEAALIEGSAEVAADVGEGEGEIVEAESAPGEDPSGGARSN